MQQQSSASKPVDRRAPKGAVRARGLAVEHQVNLSRRSRAEEQKRQLLEWLEHNPEASSAAAAAEFEITPNTLSAWAKRDQAFGDRYRALLQERNNQYLERVAKLAQTDYRLEIVDGCAAAKETFLKEFEQSLDAIAAATSAGRSMQTIRAWSTPSHVSYDREFALKYKLLKETRLDVVNEGVLGVALGLRELPGDQVRTMTDVLRYQHPDWQARTHVTGEVQIDVTAHTSPEARVAAASSNQELIMSGSTRAPDYKRRPNDLSRLLG